MEIKEHEPLGRKTTMRIGGTARYFADLQTKQDIEDAYAFALEKNVPLIALGGGSNTIFADSEINALVIRVSADHTEWNDDLLTVGAGKNLPMLINESAKTGHDLSPLTGILGTVGGAVYGNAGQGPKGIWIDQYVESVTFYADGTWQTFTKDQCDFGYRESAFKHMSSIPIIFETTLRVPSRSQEDIENDIKALLQKRIETQPHVKTAGSCFKAKNGTPAWQLIDKAGLRGTQIGGVQVAEKHANFLLNTGDATFKDAVAVVEKLREEAGELDVEMRFIGEDGEMIY